MLFNKQNILKHRFPEGKVTKRVLDVNIGNHIILRKALISFFTKQPKGAKPETVIDLTPVS